MAAAEKAECDVLDKRTFAPLSGALRELFSFEDGITASTLNDRAAHPISDNLSVCGRYETGITAKGRLGARDLQIVDLCEAHRTSARL